MSVFAVAVAAFVATTVVVANFVIDVVSKAIVAVPATAFDVQATCAHVIKIALAPPLDETGTAERSKAYRNV